MNVNKIDYARHDGERRGTRAWPWVVFSVLGAALLWLIVIAALPEPRSRPTANRVRCGSNLRQIGQACLLYANENKGLFPATMEDMLLTQDLTSAVFVCPSSNDSPASGPTTQATVANLSAGGHCSYLYFGKGFTDKTANASTIIACEPLANHGNQGMNVLYGDYHVDWVDATAANRLLSELNAGHNPPRPEKLD